MGIWLELGIFGLVLVFAFWQMHDVRKAQAHTRQQRALEKAQEPPQTQATEPAPSPQGEAPSKGPSA